jgi:hypothetical protein
MCRNKIKLSTKLAAEYRDVQTLPPVLAGQQAGPAGPKRPPTAGQGPAAGSGMKLIGGPEAGSTYVKGCIESMDAKLTCSSNANAPVAEPRSLVKFRHQQGFSAEGGQAGSRLSQALMRKKEAREVKPVYHPQCMFGPSSSWTIRLIFRETVKSHLGSYGLGQSDYSGSSKSMVRDRCGRSCHQGGFIYTRLMVKHRLMADLGSGFGRVEIVVDGSYFDYPRPCRFRQTSVHVLLCRRQGERNDTAEI